MTTILAVLSKVKVADGIRPTVGANELTTRTEMVEPGATADGFAGVAVTVTGIPTDRLSTNVCNCAAVAGVALEPPCTEAQRAPSWARLETVLYCHTARPN